MQNLLDPAILFFVFGVFAGMLRSNLEVPAAIAKFLSLYLLMALGLKGGFALAKSGLTADIALSLSAAIAMAFIVPALGYAFLKNRISRYDAAAVAASCGLVSAVTFVTAMQYLENAGLNFGGQMAVAMVVMESPAIIMAVLLANALRHAATAPASVAVVGNGTAVLTAGGPGGRSGPSIGKILHESFTDGAHLLLLGAMAVGYISGESGKAVMQPFSGDLFKGMLAFFLLALAWLLGLPVADAALLMVLSASASYIVVPAVLRYAIPEANPALYFGLSLGVTFPINILLGIPVYTAIAQQVLH